MKNSKRSDFPAPMVMRSSLDDVWNPVDGKRYTCRRQYEKAVIASGNRIAGNDIDFKNARPKEATTSSAKADIARAFEEAASK
jgi:hypothetical protein